MSGGVDSSVTLALLTDPDITSHLELDISAVFMRNWSPLQNEVDHHSFETDCEWEKDWEDVKEVCKTRGVKAELVSMSIVVFAVAHPVCSHLLVSAFARSTFQMNIGFKFSNPPSTPGSLAKHQTRTFPAIGKSSSARS